MTNEEIKQSLLGLAKVCDEVFELTGRAVPSNHSERIKKSREEVKAIIKKLEQKDGAAEQQPASAGV